MQRVRALGAVALLGLSGCGGDDDTAAPEPAVDRWHRPVRQRRPDGAGRRRRGFRHDRRPAAARAGVRRGRRVEYTLTEPGALAGAVSDESIAFSFRLGDNEVTHGAGANRTDGEWFDAIDLVVNPTEEAGPISYFPDLAAQSDRVVVDGASMSYTGPMRKQPANDGSNPPAVDVGDGTISITCP